MPDQGPINQGSDASGGDAAERAGDSLNEGLRAGLENERGMARANAKTAGCTPATLAIIGLVILLVVGIGVLVFGNSFAHEGIPEPSATSTASTAGLDGDWLLVSGLTNPQTDMPFACSGCEAYTVTVDPPAASIDISGTTITGGEYKTGFTATLAGDKCAIEQQARIDATVSGGVDPTQNYGTLVIDGTPTAFFGCDSNYQPIPQTGVELGHFSRLFYVKYDTLYLCQNLNATFDGCTGPNGGAAADPLATFQR